MYLLIHDVYYDAEMYDENDDVEYHENDEIEEMDEIDLT